MLKILSKSSSVESATAFLREHSGVGHHDGRFPKRFLGFRKQSLDICRLGNIRLQRDGLPSSFGDGLRDFASRRRTGRVIYHHRRASFRQLLRDSPPNAPRTSGYDCSFSL
jgi:hypothetical protein